MQITNYRNAVAKLKGILDNRASYLIIHYSCESFRERNQAKSPRITSIAIRSLESGQIESFSIHKIAEKKAYRWSRSATTTTNSNMICSANT